MDAMTRDPININTASAQELCNILPSTDEELAARIVAYRDAHGPFGSLTELGNVEGIDLGWLEERAALLSLGASDYRDVELIPVVDIAIEEADATVEKAAQSVVGEAEAALPATGGPVAEARVPEGPPIVWGAEPQEQPSIEEEPSQAIGELSDELPDLAQVLEQSRDLEEGTMGEAVSGAPGVAARPKEATAGVQARPAGPQAVAKAQPERVRARLGFWRGALLVLLGALGGALLALVSLGLISGTLSFTPRREYNALNRNVDTMQRNQELTWDRVDEATARTEALERELERLSTLEGRLGTVEDSLDTTAATLETLKAEAATLVQDVADTLQSVDQLGQRVDSAEDGLSTVQLSLDKVQKDAQSLQERVTRFDTFFKALRDLLVDLDVEAEPVAVE
mgnify:CR=1 FL=1